MFGARRPSSFWKAFFAHGEGSLHGDFGVAGVDDIEGAVLDVLGIAGCSRDGCVVAWASVCEEILKRRLRDGE
jgi:hypothetical protein